MHPVRDVNLQAVWFMCFVLSVAAVNALAQTGGFAPADQRAFNSLVAGKRILADDGGDGSVDAYYDFGQNGRFTAYDGVITLRGTILYTRTGSNSGTLRHDVDGIGIVQCTIGVNFASRVHGIWRWGSGCSYSGTGTWRIEGADAMPDFGGQDIGDLRFVENQAIAPRTLPQAQSGDAPLSYAIRPALPAGLAFNSATRVLSGTPSAVAPRRAYTYTVTDVDGDSASLDFTITVTGEVAEPADPSRMIPFFPPASSNLLAFSRFINHSDKSGTVRIHGVDDSGQRYGPMTLSLDALASAHFTSKDLEAGNAAKGLSGGLPDGQGSWRLELDTALDIEVSTYIRSPDGFETSMHDVARGLDAEGLRHHVPVFNPASITARRSLLRLLNLGGDSVDVVIEGRDDLGEQAPGGEVRVTLGGWQARTLSAVELEAGGAGLVGRLGDGTGRWQLTVTGDGPIRAMSLMQSPTGHLTNLSGSGIRFMGSDDGTGGALASYGKFHVIAHELSEAEDHDAECKAQLGSGFRLADWNDIVSYYEGGGSLAEFTSRLKMAPPGRSPMPPNELGNGYRISRDGRPIWSGRRHFFVARHDHDRPSFFLAHAHIDNFHLSLGSWYGTGGHALCYGGSSMQPQMFSDPLSSGGEGPTMVVIPAGSFRMGCLNDDEDCYAREFPAHDVDVPRFAMSKYEVTFAQWDACVAAGGCGGYRPDDQGWGRGDRPVTNVSWNDVKRYVAWLSGQTGEEYRLPSESEWEYAARAGTTTKYHWGDEIGVNQANCAECRDSFPNTAPVGSFPANAWGLHDVHGNVLEWVEDCWHDNYTGAPIDGTAWTSGELCGLRMLRGGSWFSVPRLLRSSDRSGLPTGARFYRAGVRVARKLGASTSGHGSVLFSDDFSTGTLDKWTTAVVAVVSGGRRWGDCQSTRIPCDLTVENGALKLVGIDGGNYTRQLHYIAPQLAYAVHPTPSARANTESFSVRASTRKASGRRVHHRHPL